MKTPRTIIVTAAFALALLGGVIWAEWQDLTSASALADQVTRASDARIGIRQLLSLLQDIESSARSFVVTGDPASLKPFTTARDGVNSQLLAVRTLTHDDPRQRARCDVLERLIAQRIALLQATVDLRRDSGFEAARQSVAARKDEAVMNQIRSEIALMNADAQSLMDRNSALARQQWRDARAFEVIGSSLSFFLLVAAFTYVWRENRLRHNAEQRLREFNDRLEQRVREQVAELEQVSRTSQEAADRVRIMEEGITDYSIVGLDPSGHVISWNAGAARLTGYQEEEIASHSFSRFYPEDEVARGGPAMALEQAAATGRFAVEGWRLRKDGTRFWADVVITALRDDAGRLNGFAKITHDLTERKQAENALRESAHFLAQSQRIARLGNWMVDLQTGTLTWSEELYRIFGVSPETFVPTVEAFLALVHRDDRSAMGSWLAPGNDPGLHQFRVVRPDGTVRAIEGCGECVVDAENRPIRLIGTAQDVTERKQAEQALRRSVDLLDQAGQIAAVGGWELDCDTQTLRWTKETYRVHEIDPVVQPSVAEAIQFYAPEVQPVIAAAVQAGIETGAPFDLELPLVTAKGRRIWVRAQGVAERRDGKTVRLYGAFQDITERRRMDESRRLQSAALQAAADAIVITDRAGVIEWVNRAFTRLTGYSAEEALGKNPRDLSKSGKHTQAFFKEFWETILAGRTWHGEIINRRKDGSLYTEDQIVAPILDASGAITHFVAIKKDMTEHLQLEAQYRQAQKMESVGRLASGIAHDFNNLLTVINGTSELLLDQVSPDSPMHADLQDICSSGERAAALTRQLLAFSRQQILEPRVMNLSTVVAGMESLLRRLLGEDIDLMVVSPPDLGNVNADRGQIEQVITNLAVNARDAMPQGGRLTIETQNVAIDEAYVHQHGVVVPRGSYVVLAMSDSGAGMDEATRARIFEPFFTTKHPGKGTGLGLSTAYGIVKQSHGFIWVYSEVGRGTTFKIYLPEVTGAGTAVRPELPVNAGSGSETIILVEDNTGLRKLAARVLKSAGYTVHGAATGEEALRVLEHHEAPVQLLLSDVVMPGMSGRQLAERLAQTHPGVKVLYMSGYTDDTVVRHGVLDVQVPFLNKPFTAAMLLRKVRQVLDS